MDKEQAILNYMKNLDISREEAEQLWLDDKEDFIGEEAEEMTKKAKSIKRYEQADKTEKKTKVKKLDEEKVKIISLLFEMLQDTQEMCFQDLTIKNEQKEITFILNGNDYSLSLTKHKKKN